MSIKREDVEARVAALSEASLDEKRIAGLISPEGGQDELLRPILEITEIYRQAVAENFIGPMPETRGRADEEAGAALLGLPSVDELLDLGVRIDKFRRQIIARLQIPTEELLMLQKAQAGQQGRENMRVVDDVHTPPDALEPPVGDGEGNGVLTEFSERLTAFRYLLYTLGIDPDDPAQVQMEIGRVEKNMMRRVSYVSVFIKDLGRLVELCNQVGNRSFVWKTGDSENIARYAAMGKDEKKQMLAEQPEQGIGIVMSKGWMERMRVYLKGEEVAGGTEVNPKPPRILEDLRDAEKAADAVRDILESECVLKIEERIEGDRKERVLVWKKTINPNKKYGGHISVLGTFLGRIRGVDGKALRSFPSIVQPIRELYAGRFDREEAANPDMKFELADQAGREDILRSLLEAEGIVNIDERGEAESKERVLVWEKTMNTGKKYQGHIKVLCALFGQWKNIDGYAKYLSFASLIGPIRDLYAGKFDREEVANPDMKFELADQAGREGILRSLLEAEGIIKIEEREEGGSSERVLVWLKTVNPTKKYGGNISPLCTLLGKTRGDGHKASMSFPSIVQPIRELYADRFDREECITPDMTFEIADQAGQEEILRSLFEAEGVVHVEERGEKEPRERVLVWKKVISPQKKYGGNAQQLQILLGRIRGVNGQKAFTSFPSIVQPIRELYAGRFDCEECITPDMTFEMAQKQDQEGMIRSLLEAEGIIKIEEREEGDSSERVLVWLKIINPNKKYGGHISLLCTLLGKIRGADGGVDGGKAFTSFPSMVQPIRELYAGRFDCEEWLIPKPKGVQKAR